MIRPVAHPRIGQDMDMALVCMLRLAAFWIAISQCDPRYLSTVFAEFAISPVSAGEMANPPVYLVLSIAAIILFVSIQKGYSCGHAMKMQNLLHHRPAWAALAVLLAGLGHDWLTGSAYPPGVFTLGLRALFGYMAGEVMLRQHSTLLAGVLQGLLTVLLGSLALPFVSGLVQVPRVGLEYLPEVIANVWFEARQQWPAIAGAGVALGLLHWQLPASL